MMLSAYPNPPPAHRTSYTIHLSPHQSNGSSDGEDKHASPHDKVSLWLGHTPERYDRYDTHHRRESSLTYRETSSHHRESSMHRESSTHRDHSSTHRYSSEHDDDDMNEDDMPPVDADLHDDEDEGDDVFEQQDRPGPMPTMSRFKTTPDDFTLTTTTTEESTKRTDRTRSAPPAHRTIKHHSFSDASSHANQVAAAQAVAAVANEETPSHIASTLTLLKQKRDSKLAISRAASAHVRRASGAAGGIPPTIPRPRKMSEDVSTHVPTRRHSMMINTQDEYVDDFIQEDHGGMTVMPISPATGMNTSPTYPRRGSLTRFHASPSLTFQSSPSSSSYSQASPLASPMSLDDEHPHHRHASSFSYATQPSLHTSNADPASSWPPSAPSPNSINNGPSPPEPIHHVPVRRNSSFSRPSPSKIVPPSALTHRTSITNPSSDTQEQYILSCDLRPCTNPNEEIKTAIRSLKSSDWSVRFDALTLIRRLVVRHVDVVIPHVRAIVRDLRSEVESLRSSIAKNAIMCLTDMFDHAGKTMDVELDHVIPALLKRAGEANVFLAEEANKALLAMIHGVSDQKSLAVLLNHSSQGNKTVKSMAGMMLERYIEIQGSKLPTSRELSRVLRIVTEFSGDATSQVRSSARLSLARLSQLLGMSELDKQIKKAVTATQYASVKKMLDKGFSDVDLSSSPFCQPRNSIVNASPTTSSPSSGLVSGRSRLRRGAGSEASAGKSDDGLGSVKNGRALFGSLLENVDVEAANNSTTASCSSPSITSSPSSGLGSRRSASTRRTSSASPAKPKPCPEAEQLPEIYAEMSASDWRSRVTALQQLADLVLSSPTLASHPQHLLKIYEQLGERIHDSNGKVNAEALKCVSTLLPITKTQLTPIIPTFLPIIINLIASNTLAIKQTACALVDMILELMNEPYIALQPMTTIISYGNARVRPFLLEKLATLLPSCYTHPQGSKLIIKHVLPCILPLCDESKTEIRVANARVVSCLYGLMGESLFETTTMSPTQIKGIRAIIAQH